MEGVSLRFKSSAVLLLALVFSCLLLAETTTAKSFPFRVVKNGDPLPAISLAGVKGNGPLNLSSADGKSRILVFVGADLESKKKRSIKALKAVAELTDFLAKKGVEIIIIDAQGDEEGVVAELLAEAKLDLPAYSDPGRAAYGRLGIFVMPSLLLVAPDGRIAAGMGYSHDMGKRLKGAVEIMLGEKTAEQVEAELHPQMVEMSKEETDSRRHYHLGLTLKEKGQPEMAVKEMQKAIKIDAKMGKAHIQLGCLYLDLGKNDQARAEVGTGLELEPDDLTGQICRARLKATAGKVDEAIDDLRVLMFRHLRSPDLHYWLGTFYDSKQDLKSAAAEYRKGFELLKRHSLSGGK